jgi:hypothetical protein
VRAAGAWIELGALTLVLALAGCGRTAQRPPSAPPVHLSTDRPDGNAAGVADFVRRVCIDHIGDPGAIAQAIAESRWPAEEVAASAGQIVTVREMEHGRIAYSAIPFEAPGGRFSDCQVELDGAVAPAIARVAPLIARALQPVSPRRTQNGPDRFAWTWQTPPTGERELTLAATAPRPDSPRPGLTIHVSSADYTLSAAAAPADTDAAANEAAPAPAANVSGNRQ